MINIVTVTTFILCSRCCAVIILHALFHLNLIATQKHRYNYYPHFTDEETET